MGRTYRVRVYAPKRGRSRRGSRSALTYCSTFVAHSSLSELRSRANPETQNATPAPSSSAIPRPLPSLCFLTGVSPLSLFLSPSLPLSVVSP